MKSYVTYQVTDGDNGLCIQLANATPEERLRDDPKGRGSQVEAMKGAVRHFASITGLTIIKEADWELFVERTAGNCNVWFAVSEETNRG